MKKLLFTSIGLLLLVSACTKEKEADPVYPSENLIEIKTTYGTMYMWLYKETPLHRTNFLGLADTGFFDNTTFHRCIPNFMIQGGDPNSKDNNPNNDGQGGPGYTIPAEIRADLKHERGTVAAARLGDAQNPARASSGSQFYICVSTHGTQSLNGAYTVFGKILKGIEVADSIVSQPRNASDRPLTDIKMDVNVVSRTTKELEEEFNFYGYK